MGCFSTSWGQMDEALVEVYDVVRFSLAQSL